MFCCRPLEVRWASWAARFRMALCAVVAAFGCGCSACCRRSCGPCLDLVCRRALSGANSAPVSPPVVVAPAIASFPLVLPVQSRALPPASSQRPPRLHGSAPAAVPVEVAASAVLVSPVPLALHLWSLTRSPARPVACLLGCLRGLPLSGPTYRRPCPCSCRCSCARRPEAGTSRGT